MLCILGTLDPGNAVFNKDYIKPMKRTLVKEPIEIQNNGFFDNLPLSKKKGWSPENRDACDSNEEQARAEDRRVAGQDASIPREDPEADRPAARIAHRRIKVRNNACCV